MNESVKTPSGHSHGATAGLHGPGHAPAGHAPVAHAPAVQAPAGHAPGYAPKRGLFVRRGVPVLVIAAALLGVLAISQIPSRPQDSQMDPPAPVNVKVLSIVPLTAQTAGGRSELLQDSVTLQGQVLPNRVVTVSSEVAATIEKLPLAKGSDVQAGEPLVQLNRDMIQASLDRAQAAFSFAKEQHAKVVDLSRKNAARPQEVDEAQNKLDLAKADLDTAQANSRRTTIKAPVAGVLDEQPVEVGQYVAPGACVAKIVEMDTVKVVVDVPESDIAFLSVGDAADIACTANSTGQDCPPVKMAGKITFISVQADPVAHTTRTEITVANPRAAAGKRPLHTNQMVAVRLVRRQLASLISIPLDAVIPLEKGKIVFVAQKAAAGKGTIAHERSVTLGLIRGREVQILGGLQAGDQLIVDGQRYVADGQAVRIIAPE